MKNEAVSAIFEHLCNDARNFLHVTYGAIDIASSAMFTPAQRAACAIGRSSADRLLRCIDDVHELISNAPAPPSTVEEIDMTLSVGEIVSALNLASGRRRRQMDLDTPDAIFITQDRKSLEQVLTRLLDTAFKLTHLNDVHVTLSRNDEQGVRLAIHSRDGELAARLANWLNSNLDDAGLEAPGDVPLGIAMMVAGKRLRALGGSATQIKDAAGHASVALDFPSLANAFPVDDSDREVRPDALNVLVAEDSEESYTLCELTLEHDHVHRARDGQEAVRMIQKQRFDVVLMDVHMPGMDGYSAIRSIRDWETQTGNARTPLVVLSSDDVETQQRFAAQSGCSGFLRKPLRLGDLSNLLDRLKETRQLVA